MKDNKTHRGIAKVLMNMAAKPMFINKQYAKDLLLQFDATLSVVASSETAVKEHLEHQKDITAIAFYNASSNILNVRRSGNFGDVPKGSVAVVPVMGAMMRDDYCTMAEGNVAGTRTLEKVVTQLDNNENVDGIVFQVNTPGGEAFGNESLAKTIKNCGTPTVAFFEMMASAGVFAFQGVDEIYAAEKNSMWGSIGTFITLVNDEEFWSDMGVEFLEIYASESTEKNLEFREAREGNTEPMVEFLDSLNSTFIQEVKKARPEIKDDGSVFKGKLYNAVEARKIGAIDGIKDLSFAISRARYLSRNPNKRKQRKKSNSKNQVAMSIEKKQAGWFQRFMGANTSVEEADKKIEEANQAVEKIEGENKDLKASAKENEEKINALQEENGKLKTSATENQEKITSLEENNKALTSQVAELEEKLAQSEKGAGELKTKVDELTEQTEKLIDHNKKLGGPGNAATPTDTENQTSHKQDAKDMEKVNTQSEYDRIMGEMEAKKKAKD